MRIQRQNKTAIAKALQTLRRMEEYKKKLKSFLEALSDRGTATHTARPPQLLLTHFTSRESAGAIIADRQIKTGKRGYVALTALHPLEFKTVAGPRRSFGFAFFAHDLLCDQFDLYSPVAYLRADGIAKEIQTASPELCQRLLCEPTESQPSLRFLNLMEVRSGSPIPLDRCALFFRERDLDPSKAAVLNDLGIFQLPYSVSWFRDHFVTSQCWYYNETEDSVEFFDNRNCIFSTADIIEKLHAINVA